MNPVRRSASLLLRHIAKPQRIQLALNTTYKRPASQKLRHTPRIDSCVLLARPFSSRASDENEELQPQPPNSAPLEVPPLPALPPAVKGWPSFWVIRREVEEYLYPLYARGWGVRFLPRKNYLSSNDRYVAYLTTAYTFSNFNCAAQFIADMVELANSEKHHPSLFSLQNAKRPIVNLHVQTDYALRPRWNEEDPSADPPLPRKVPGITRRDLRFAVLLEEQYDAYHKDGRALEMRGTRIKPQYDRPTWEHLVSRFVKCTLFTKAPKDLIEGEERRQMLEIMEDPGWTPTPVIEQAPSGETVVSTDEEARTETIKCHACGGPHKLQDCAVRGQYPPPVLCSTCLEPHWWPDCPERPKEGFAQGGVEGNLGAASPSKVP